MKLLLRGILVVAGALAGLVLLGLIWLALRPVDLAFLVPRLEASLSAPEAAIRAEIGRAELAWASWRRGPRVRMHDVRVFGNGDVLADLPQIAVVLSLRGVLRGRVEPVRLEIDGARVRIARLPDGRLELGLQNGAAPSPAAPDAPRSLLQQLLGPRDPAEPISSLRRILVRDADLAIEDRLLGLAWRAPHAELALARRPGGLRGSARLDLDLAGERGQVQADLDYDAAARLLDVVLEIEDVDPSRLARGLPELGLGSALSVSVPLSGRIASRMRTGEAFAAVDVVELQLALRGGAGVLRLPELQPQPIPIESLRLSGHLAEDLAGAELETLELKLGPAPVSLRGSAEPLEGGHVRFRLEGRIGAFDVADLGAVWPPALAPGGREWVVSHIPQGRMSQAALELALLLPGGRFQGAQIDGLRGTIDADALVVDYLPALPPARDVATRIRFDAQRLDAEVERGTLRDLAIEAGRVTLTGLDRTPRLAVSARVTGPLRTALEVIDAEPLGLASRFGLAPGTLDGTHDTSLELGLALRDGAEPKVSVRSSLRELRAERGPLVDLEAADLVLAHEPDRFELSGDLSVGGNAIHARLLQRADDAPELELAGPRLALGPLLEAGDGELLQQLPARLALRAAFDELQLGTPPLRGFRLSARREADRWDEIEAEARIRDAGETRLSYRSHDGLRFRCDDLGQLLEAAGFSDRLRGGVLRIDGRRPSPEAPLEGRFELTDFRVLRAPALARVLQALSLTRLLDAFRNRGLDFTSLAGDFRYASGTLHVDDGRAIGTSVSLTLAGDVDVAARSGELSGVVIPLDTMNRLLAKIPLLSAPFIGLDGEGLIAADYAASGLLAEPEVRVNRLSALAPGILRVLVPGRGSVRNGRAAR